MKDRITAKESALLLVLRNCYNASAPEEINLVMQLHRLRVIPDKNDCLKLLSFLNRVPCSLLDELQTILDNGK